MQKTFNECVGCADYCMGTSCPNRSVTRFFCDKCDEEMAADEIYIYDGQELCEFCLKETCRREW